MNAHQRRVLQIALVTLAIGAHAAIAAQQQDDVRIYGRVMTDSGAPLRGVAVTLTMPGAKTWTTATDDNGSFDVRGLPPGAYQLRLVKTGFLAPALYQAIPSLKNGEGRDVGAIVMRRAGAIAGRVIDETGEPIVGVAVSANRVVFSPPGSRSLQPIKTVATNDLGEYRLFGLEPGAYYVSAAGRNAAVELSLAMVRAEQQITFVAPESPRGFAPTFWPSALTQTEAQQIRLAVGENRLGVDVALVNQPLSRVSGRVMMSSGVPAIDGIVMLDAAERSDVDMFNRQSARIGDDGSFLIRDVLPGQYRVLAYSHDYSPLPNIGAVLVSKDGNRVRAAKPPPANAPRGYESAKASVSVAGDVGGIEIQLSRAFEIRGRVVVDGVPRAAGTTDMMRVGFEVHENGYGPFPPSAVVQQSGEFVLVGAPPGRTRLAVSGLAASSMISRVSFNGVDVTDEGLDVSASISGVEIAITTRPAVAVGTVATATDQRTASYVIVFSENSRFWTMPATRHLQLVTSSSSGEFKASRLPAGRYFAVAVPTLDPLTWADPENLAELRKVATPFTMPESGTVTVNLVRR